MTSYYDYQNTLVFVLEKINAIVFQTSPGLTNLNRKAKAKRNPVVLGKCRHHENGQLIVSYNTKSLAFNWSIGVF